MAGVLAAPLQRVWVSGGSRSIGLALATRVLEASGTSSVVVSSRGARASEGVAALAARFGAARVEAVDLDLTDQRAVRAAAAAIASKGKLDAVLNTVGVLHDGPGQQPEKRLKDVDAAWALRSYQVNGLAPLLLAQAVIEADALDRDRWTCLVNLSAKVGSISDNRVGSWYSYRMAKAAQNMANKCVSIELKRLKRKTLCVGIHPGTVATPLSKPFTQNYANEIFSVDKASAQIMSVIANLDPELHCGQLINWDGSIIQP